MSQRNIEKEPKENLDLLDDKELEDEINNSSAKKSLPLLESEIEETKVDTEAQGSPTDNCTKTINFEPTQQKLPSLPLSSSTKLKKAMFFRKDEGELPEEPIEDKNGPELLLSAKKEVSPGVLLSKKQEAPQEKQDYLSESDHQEKEESGSSEVDIEDSVSGEDSMSLGGETPPSAESLLSSFLLSLLSALSGLSVTVLIGFNQEILSLRDSLEGEGDNTHILAEIERVKISKERVQGLAKASPQDMNREESLEVAKEVGGKFEEVVKLYWDVCDLRERRNCKQNEVTKSSDDPENVLISQSEASVPDPTTSSLKEQADSLRQEISAMRAESSQLESLISDSSAQLQSLVTTLSERDKQLTRLNLSLLTAQKAAETKLSTFEALSTTLSKQISSKETKLSSLEKAFSRVKSEVENRLKKLDLLESLEKRCLVYLGLVNGEKSSRLVKERVWEVVEGFRQWERNKQRRGD